MKIGLVGGTGNIGEGLAIRWAKNKEHEIFIGSRNEEKAKNKAEKYEKILRKNGYEPKIKSGKNSYVVKNSDVVLLSIPYECIEDMLPDLRELFANQIVISPIVPMYKSKNSFECKKICAAENIRDILPNSVKVVSAFHTVPAPNLRKIDYAFDSDVVVFGDEKKAKEAVFMLIEEIKGLRALDGGPLSLSYLCEGITPLLLNISMRNDVKHPTIKFVDT